jgi:hypothetical protein
MYIVRSLFVVIRVSDPYSFFPDPAFEAGDQSVSNPDPIRIQGFNDQKLKKMTAKKKLYFFGSKTAIYLSLGLHKVPMFKLQKKPAAHKRGHPTLQNMIFFYCTFVGHFCPPGSGSGFRIRIRIHWPD